MEAGLTADKVAETEMVPETVEFAVGAVMATEGVLVWVYTYAPMSQPEP
jgi:hypothetical protein